MQIIKVSNYDEMSLVAANILEKRIKENELINMGFATGGTPVGVYENLINSYEKKEVSFQNVRSFNLDEYIGISKEHPKSYHYFMMENLFKYVDVPKNKIHIPNGKANDLVRECKDYEREIERHGGIDIQILGIGTNGHIGFNEPGTSFKQKTHIIRLDESTRKANARFFSTIDEVPTHAITMGLSTIMKSKEILLLVSGLNKAETFKQLMEKNISETLPASILHQHHNVTVIVDDLALSKTKI